MGNEWANYYFPDTFGSYWTYENHDGEEFTRYAIAPEEIDGETYRAFSYDPALEDWEDYKYHLYPFYYQVSDDWVAFYNGEEIENAFKAVVRDKLEEGFLEPFKEQLNKIVPPGVTFEVNTTVEAEAQDYFYLLPTPATFNEEWNSMLTQGKFVIRIDLAGDPNEIPPGGALIFTFNFNILETGAVTATETLETPAGTFEDCLKIEFQAEMGMTLETIPPMENTQSMLPANSKFSTTIWLAPNVGIVKIAEGSENDDAEKFFELTKYEIKTTASNSNKND